MSQPVNLQITLLGRLWRLASGDWLAERGSELESCTKLEGASPGDMA